jgi:xylulokinase
VRLVAGIDLGTQSVKAVVCDEAMTVVGSHSVALTTAYPRPGWAEQDPRAWEAALERALAGAVGDRGGEVAALAIAGQLDGCVAVDASGDPLHPALIWQDRRATAYVTAVELETTGQVADASHMAPKIAWLRAHGIRAARWHQPVSYLVARLTGADVMDPSHASTTMLYDLRTGAWLDDRELPSIAPATSIAGVLRAPLAGIAAGTPVAVGTGDDFSTPLGAGLVAPGPLAVTLGTAEVVGALSPAPVFDRPAARAADDPYRDLPSPMVETHAYPTGACFIENPGWLSGGAVRWATRLLGLTSDQELDALAAAAPSSEGVTFVPALAGAMTPAWNAAARASLHGLTAGHDRPHVARAILEGLAFACRDVATRLRSLGLAIPHALVLGGGSASAIWLQIRADALQLPHHVAARSDTSAIGAAMIASVAAGVHADLCRAAACAPPPRTIVTPRASLDDAYARYQILARRTS